MDRRRIMVVEDNEDAAEALRMMLELESHEVRTAGDGAAAIAILDGFQPQIILCDIGLPDIDGYSLCRDLRKRMNGAKVTIIALTGYGQDDDVRRAMEAGFDRHLRKPVEPEALIAALDKQA